MQLGGPQENFVAELSLRSSIGVGIMNQNKQKRQTKLTQSPQAIMMHGGGKTNAIEPPMRRMVDRLRFSFLESKEGKGWGTVENKGIGVQSSSSWRDTRWIPPCVNDDDDHRVGTGSSAPTGMTITRAPRPGWPPAIPEHPGPLIGPGPSTLTSAMGGPRTCKSWTTSPQEIRNQSALTAGFDVGGHLVRHSSSTM
ncbi:hypothetical protein N7474_011192 [Penicillium riverlandense]|uniref:uncharacterized protein n=1 Tax=Penicillium riverlandense TaxID=1903569 RepID=UPI002548C7C5|nr:uncharacterized protein N7474_011192 [Penicillium riverlandense]KAJ5805305.1 hypothetical protein N7474_011192 [Penicillium riverlandense]